MRIMAGMKISFPEFNRLLRAMVLSCFSFPILRNLLHKAGN
jgi:hypothetical protein